MSDKEIWKPIEGHPKHEVSNFGRVRSLMYGKERIMKLQKGKNGRYRRVMLERKGKIFFVHRLVAEAFIPNPDNLPQINHKDGDNANNHVDNLEWCDERYNQWHRFNVLKHTAGGEEKHPIMCVETGKTYRSIWEAHEKTGINRANIWRALTKKTKQGEMWKAGGFHWKSLKTINPNSKGEK